MRWPLLLCLFLACAAPAHASDKLHMAPPPGWVAVTALPPSPKPNSAPFDILLSDQQMEVDRQQSSSFHRTAVRIANGQGLAAGSVAIGWRPDFDDVTVHWVRIVRGSQTIDVLAGGQAFTIARREPSLELATLDGVLTASLQPEGLQVGDIVDFAVSVRSSDPTLRGHVQQTIAAWNGLPLKRGRVSVAWPADLPLRIRSYGDLPELKPTPDGKFHRVQLQRDDIQPIVSPKGAPARFAVGRSAELTSFKSWAEVAALIAPLYRAPSVIPASGPLRAELDKIRAGSADPRVRAEQALALVQERIRYVALLMGTGNLVPATAAETWARRFGDCKAKTALLLGLLHELGIAAIPVAVRITAGDAIESRLPMVGLFDHVLVRARIGASDYWLDGTRTGDKQLSRLTTPAFGWGLELVESNGRLVALVAPPLALPADETRITIDASRGLLLPAPVKAEVLFRGSGAAAFAAAIALMPDAARDEALRGFWADRLENFTATKVAAVPDPATGDLRLTAAGDARIDWSGGYHQPDDELGFDPNFKRADGPNRDAPFAVNHPLYRSFTQSILLPPGFTNGRSPSVPALHRTLAGVEYRRTGRFQDDRFTLEASERSLVPEVPAATARADEEPLRALHDSGLRIRIPVGYAPGKKDIESALSIQLDNTGDLIRRGALLLAAGRFDTALVDFNAALKLEPANQSALANRAIAYVWLEKYDAARADLDTVAAADPNNLVMLRARGLMALQRSESEAAVAAFSKALEIEPNDTFSLGHRAKSYAALRQYEAARADAARALANSPGWSELRLILANAYANQGESARALAEADAILAVSVDKVYDLVAVAAIYSRFGKKAEAAAAYDKALAIKPEAFVYLNRALTRPNADHAGRRADLDAALKLAPDDQDALMGKGRLLEDQTDWQAAHDLYARMLRADPGFWAVLLRRGIVLARLGRTADAEKDFAAAQVSGDLNILNSMCRAKATAGVMLETALADCDKALQRAPGLPAYLNSKALVLLRLGRPEDAIRLYDQALSGAKISSSLMGRAVAKARLGRRQDAESDRVAARALNPNVEEEFAAYGLTF